MAERLTGATDLLDGQFQQLRQAGRQHADEEGGGRAADVQHAGGQHRDEGVLPGEGVEQRQHRVGAPRQHAAREREREGREGGLASVATRNHLKSAPSLAGRTSSETSPQAAFIDVHFLRCQHLASSSLGLFSQEEEMRASSRKWGDLQPPQRCGAAWEMNVVISR